MIEHRSDYKELRRNQVGLNSLDEPQTSLGVRRPSGVSLGPFGGWEVLESVYAAIFRILTLLAGRLVCVRWHTASVATLFVL